MDISLESKGQKWKLTAWTDRGANFLGVERDGKSVELEVVDAKKRCEEARAKHLIVRGGLERSTETRAPVVSDIPDKNEDGTEAPPTWA